MLVGTWHAPYVNTKFVHTLELACGMGAYIWKVKPSQHIVAGL